MRNFLIGCGAVALLGVMAIAVGGFILFKSARQMRDRFAAVHERAQSLETRFPFQHTEGQNVDGARLDVWFGVVEEAGKIKEALTQRFETMKDQKTARLKMMKEAMGTAQEMMERPIAILENAKMPLSEFRYLTDQVVNTLSSEAAKADSDLRDSAIGITAVIQSNSAARDSIGAIQPSAAQAAALIALLKERKSKLDGLVKTLPEAMTSFSYVRAMDRSQRPTPPIPATESPTKASPQPPAEKSPQQQSWVPLSRVTPVA